MFASGYRHLTLGRIIIFPANCATTVLRLGSSRATRSQNGKRLRFPVLFYGYMENVRLRLIPMLLLQRLKFLLCGSRRWKEHILVRQIFIYPYRGTHHVG